MTKPSSDHNPSTMAKPLPQDIIPEILTRLPVKSLLRFKCVSKPWHSMINDPNFIKNHLKHAILNNYLNLMLRGCGLLTVPHSTSYTKSFEIEYPFKSPECGVEVLGSCNGLLLITTRNEDVCLWNPATKDYREIPTAEIEFPETGFQCCRNSLHGLGFDSASDDYKVVRIIFFYGDGDDNFNSEVKVYSLKANSWRRIQDVPYYFVYKRLPGVLVNGSLHWVATRTPESDLRKLIVGLDVVEEKFKVVPQPDYPNDCFHMNIGVLGGCLCVLANFYKVQVDIWVMKEYGVKQSWIKGFTIMQPAVVQSFEYVKPICFAKTGELVLEKDNKDLLLYDPKSAKARRLEISGIPNWFETETYIESLVPINLTLESLNFAVASLNLNNQNQKKGKGKEKAKSKMKMRPICLIP